MKLSPADQDRYYQALGVHESDIPSPPDVVLTDGECRWVRAVLQQEEDAMSEVISERDWARFKELINTWVEQLSDKSPGDDRGRQAAASSLKLEYIFSEELEYIFSEEIDDGRGCDPVEALDEYSDDAQVNLEHSGSNRERDYRASRERRLGRPWTGDDSEVYIEDILSEQIDEGGLKPG